MPQELDPVRQGAPGPAAGARARVGTVPAGQAWPWAAGRAEGLGAGRARFRKTGEGGEGWRRFRRGAEARPGPPAVRAPGTGAQMSTCPREGGQV